MKWTPKQIERLQVFLMEGLSYARIGKRFGCSRLAIAGAVRRHIQKIPDSRRGLRQAQVMWTETRLTETYSDRKKRLAAERTLNQET